MHGEARVIAKDGRVVHVEYRAHPERNPDGSLAGILGAFRDVSLQKQQQTRARRRAPAAAGRHQQAPGDRSASCRKSKEEAERRANEAEEARAAVKDREQRLHYEAQLKDEFLATLAHELRNPLAPLRNVAEILRLEPLQRNRAPGHRRDGAADLRSWYG